MHTERPSLAGTRSAAPDLPRRETRTKEDGHTPTAAHTQTQAQRLVQVYSAVPRGSTPVVRHFGVRSGSGALGLRVVAGTRRTAPRASHSAR